MSEKLSPDDLKLIEEVTKIVVNSEKRHNRIRSLERFVTMLLHGYDGMTYTPIMPFPPIPPITSEIHEDE